VSVGLETVGFADSGLESEGTSLTGCSENSVGDALTGDDGLDDGLSSCIEDGAEKGASTLEGASLGKILGKRTGDNVSVFVGPPDGIESVGWIVSISVGTKGNEGVGEDSGDIVGSIEFGEDAGEIVGNVKVGAKSGDVGICKFVG
jgi:hypothetical protein